MPADGSAGRAAARLAWPPWVSTVALLLPAYAWLTLAVFLPLIAMLVFSFLSATPMGRKPVEFTLKQYRAFYDQPYLLGVAWTSIRIALTTTAVSAVLGFLAALALVRATAGRTRQALLVLLLLPFWTNGLVRVFSWTMVLRENGLIDRLLHAVLPGAASVGFLYSEAAIVVGLVHGYLPYMVLTCFIALASIDDSLLEASASLGGRWPATLVKIILPLSLPGLLSGAVLIFVPVVGSFMEPRILGGRYGVTLGTVIEDQFTQAFNWPLGASLSFTMLAVVLAIFATFSGVLRQGLAA